MGKIFEKIAQRIAISGLHRGAVCNTQMGGQAQNSAIDALLHILDRIGCDISKRINYSKKKPLRPVVLTHDIEGAINNTHPKLLTQIMSQRKMPQYLIQWAKSFTPGRASSFCFDGLKESPKLG
jgi:hypothetical protein